MTHSAWTSVASEVTSPGPATKMTASATDSTENAAYSTFDRVTARSWRLPEAPPSLAGRGALTESERRQGSDSPRRARNAPDPAGWVRPGVIRGPRPGGWPHVNVVASQYIGVSPTGPPAAAGSSLRGVLSVWHTGSGDEHLSRHVRNGCVQGAGTGYRRGRGSARAPAGACFEVERSVGTGASVLPPPGRRPGQRLRQFSAPGPLPDWVWLARHNPVVSRTARAARQQGGGPSPVFRLAHSPASVGPRSAWHRRATAAWGSVGHKNTYPSPPALARVCPSGLNATSFTTSV
jgi:hypothetical protein